MLEQFAVVVSYDHQWNVGWIEVEEVLSLREQFVEVVTRHGLNYVQNVDEAMDSYVFSGRTKVYKILKGLVSSFFNPQRLTKQVKQNGDN